MNWWWILLLYRKYYFSRILLSMWWFHLVGEDSTLWVLSVDLCVSRWSMTDSESWKVSWLQCMPQQVLKSTVGHKLILNFHWYCLIDKPQKLSGVIQGFSFCVFQWSIFLEYVAWILALWMWFIDVDKLCWSCSYTEDCWWAIQQGLARWPQCQY